MTLYLLSFSRNSLSKRSTWLSSTFTLTRMARFSSEQPQVASISPVSEFF